MEGAGLLHHLRFHAGTSIETRKKNAHKVVITGCSSGLGIRIVGGINAATQSASVDFGIFVKEVMPDSLAARDGEPSEWVE